MREINKDAEKAMTFFSYHEKLSLSKQIKVLYWYWFNKKRLVEVFYNYQMGKSIKDSFIHNK